MKKYIVYVKGVKVNKEPLHYDKALNLLYKSELLEDTSDLYIKEIK